MSDSPRIYDMEEKLRQLYLKDYRLLSLHMDLGLRCDLDCCHCYLDDKRTPELSTAEVISVLQQARDLGVLKLALGGGELFLRRDVPDLLDAARAMRFAIVLKTHGGTVSERIADKVKESGVTRVDVSVYALDETIHDAITRRRGSLVRTMRGIERLRDRGVRVRVNCSVMHANRKHYKALYEELTRRGIECNLDPSIQGTHSGALDTLALNISVDEKAELERWKHEQTGEAPSLAPADPDYHLCWAGKTSAHINPDGTVTPCVAFPMVLGDLHTQTLEQIWNHSPLLWQIRDARRKDRAGCHTCSFEHQCVYCPGKAFVEQQGDWLAPSSLQCADTLGKVHGAFRYNAERVHPRRIGHLPVLPAGALHEGPRAGRREPTVTIPAEVVEQVPRDQRGAPRKRLFRILSDAQRLEAARQAAEPAQRATR